MAKSFISDSLEALQQAQKKFSQAVGAGSVLLIDSTFQGVAKQVQKGVVELAQGNPTPEVASYLEDLQRLGIPETSADIYKQFFGPGLLFHTHPITSSDLPDLSSVSLVILSGSPANVSFALQTPNQELTPELNHGEAFKREKAIIEAALEKHIPILGLCYGHQAVSQVLGGTVSRLPAPIFGTHHTSPSTAGRSYLETLGITVSAFQLPVPAYHQDYVEVVPPESISLFQANSSKGIINYGSVHPVQQALTVQYHPEYLFIEPLLTAVRTHQPLRQPTSVSSSIETLCLFATFLSSLA